MHNLQTQYEDLNNLKDNYVTCLEIFLMTSYTQCAALPYSCYIYIISTASDIYIHLHLPNYFAAIINCLMIYMVAEDTLFEE